MAYNKYPKYSDGNILTSEALNDSFDFLHQQVMITRRLMLGNGVLNGLGYSYNHEDANNPFITIYSGTAITESGMLIELPEKRSYHYAKVVDKNEYILAEEGEKTELLSKVTDIEKYVLGLKVELKGQTEKYCTSQSCTMKDTEVLIEVVPYLVRMNEHKADNDNQSSNQKLLEELESVSMGDVVEFPALPIFLKRIDRHFEEKRIILINGFENLRKVAEYMPNDSEALKKDCKDYSDKLAKLTFKNKQCHQFHAFADDLLSAFNELIVAYNSYHSKYDVIETSDNTSSLENKVVLGSVYSAKNKEMAAHSAFQSVTSALGKNASESIIQRMFERIKLMINNFNPELKSSGVPILIPMKKNAKLGERMIPSYYNITPDFEQYWDANNESHLTVKQKVEDNEYQQADFFVWNFSDKLDKNEVINELEKNTKNRISLLKVEYKLKGDSTVYDLFDLLGTNMDKNIEINDEHIKKAKDLMSKNGYTSKFDNTLSDIINMFKKKQQPDFSKETKENLKKMDTTVISTIISSSQQKYNAAIYKIFEYIILANMWKEHEDIHGDSNSELLDAFTPIHYLGMDYQGGVKYDNILMLVTDSESNVIFTINVPASSLLLNDKLLSDIKKSGASFNKLDFSNIL